MATLLCPPDRAQTVEENFKIYTEHPRLFLRPARLRLLLRERERESIRWQQFQTLMAGKAPMVEPGFAQALYYRVAGDQGAGKQAVAWALGPGTDLRQLALVFDWCQDLLTAAQSRALAAKLQRGIDATQAQSGVSAVRNRMLAAVALGDHLPQVSTREVERLVRGWWEGRIIPGLKGGRNMLPREEGYALFEFLHAVRDNLEVDLRDAYPAFFKNLPIERLLAYYPATYPGADGEYRIPSTSGAPNPDLRRAALARAADLSIVAYDANAPGSQVLQGWLIHDHFILRGTFGITYEFLWANPYQPGLSYYHVPLIHHDEHFGRLFVRSSWEESAVWLGFFDGELQLFQDGKLTSLDPRLSSGPLSLTEAVVYCNTQKFRVLLKEEELLFVLGLKPKQAYNLEVDDEEMQEVHTDAGGILLLKVPHKIETGVRLNEFKRP